MEIGNWYLGIQVLGNKRGSMQSSSKCNKSLYYIETKYLCSIPFRKDLQAEAERKKEQNRKDSDWPGNFLTAGPHAVIRASTAQIYYKP